MFARFFRLQTHLTKRLVLPLCLVCICSAQVARAQSYTLLQKASHSAGDTTNSVSFPLPTVPGDLIVVSVAWVNGGKATIYDIAGDAFFPAVGPTAANGNANSGSSQIWYVPNALGGPNTISVNFGGAWNNSIIAVFEYSQPAASSALDVVASVTGRGGSLDGGSVTVAQAGELVFATAYGNSGGTLGSSPLQLYATQSGTHLGIVDTQTSAAGTYNATFTDTGAWDWVVQTATFKAGAAPQPPPLPSSLLCGRPDDGLIHAAPSYDVFTPGLPGTTFADLQYGCPITRIADGKSYCNSQSVHQYSTISPINADDSLIIMQLAWQCGGNSQYIADSSGAVVVDQYNFPPANSYNVPWDQLDPNTFYFSYGTTFYKATVNRSAATVSQLALCSFPEYSYIQIPDTEDISYDNNHIWLTGDPTSASGQAFLVTLDSSHTSCTKGATVNIGAKDAASGWHKIQNTPSNKLAVLSNATLSTELYNPDGTLFRRMPDTTHMDLDYNSDGVTEVAVGMFYQGTAQNGCPSNYGLGVQNLATGVVLRCLVPDAGSEDALHVSYRDSAPRGPGRVLFSLERSNGCNADKTGNDLSCINGTVGWAPYSGEEVLASIDGSGLQRLAHHRSRSSVGYWAQPRGAISKDGKVVIFDSNFNNFNGGSSTVSGWDYADTYMIRVQQ